MTNKEAQQALADAAKRLFAAIDTWLQRERAGRAIGWAKAWLRKPRPPKG